MRESRETVTKPRPDAPARVLLLKERRSAGRAAALDALLRERPDLAGVHRPADLAAEAVRWSA